MDHFQRNKTGSFPVKQSFAHYPQNYRSTKEQLDRQTSSLIQDRRNLELKTPLNSQYHIENRSLRPNSLKSYHSPKSQISEKIQEIVKLCSEDKQNIKNDFSQMTEAERRILDLLSQYKTQPMEHPTHLINSYADTQPHQGLRQKAFELLEQNKKLRHYLQNRGQQGEDEEARYLKHEIAALENKLNEYQNAITKMKGNGFDFRALYDQCESLRRDTINLLKDNNQNDQYYGNGDESAKRNFLRDLQKLRERFYELEDENKNLRSHNNQRKSYNTHTTRISPFGEKY